MNQREVPKPSIPAPEQMEVERFGENDDQYIVGQRLPLVEEFVGLFQEKGLEREAEAYRVVADFAAEVQARGGAAFLVGGCVRDHLAGKVPKDFDIEVFGLEAEEVGEVAAQFGEVSEVGKAFGIRKLFTEQGFDLDISLPRTDSKTGDGHTDVEVTVDPFMSIKEAARRRDFTINTLCANPLTGDIYDPHGGVKDLEEKILRVTDAELFADDPLRVMRGIQFVGRFDLAIDPESYEVMRDMVPHLKHLSRERFVAEWQKLLLKSEVPSKGLKMAMEMGIFHETYPDFPPLAETEQDPEFHPEGDVWTHTLMVVDKGAEGIKKRGTDPEKAFTVILADLCHDLGKPATTEHIDGHIRALGHEAAGVEPTERFLDSIGIVGKGNIQRQKVLNLVRDHMMPHQLYKTEVEHGNAIGKGAIRRLAARIYPATMEELVMVAEADYLGRGPFPDGEGNLKMPDDFSAGPWLMERAREVDVEQGKPADLLMGRELVEIGYQPGKSFKDILRLANELRDTLDYDHDDVMGILRESPQKDAIETLELALERGWRPKLAGNKE